MKIKRPMLLSAILSVVCAIAVFYCSLAIFATIIFLSIALVFNIFYLKNGKITVVLLFTVLTVIALAVSIVKIEKAKQIKSHVVEDFVITSTPYKSGSNYVAEATVISENTLKKGDKIRLNYKKSKLNVGDTVGAKVRIYPIKDDSFKEYLCSENIYMTGYVKQFTSVKTEDSLLCFLPKLRCHIKNTLTASPTSYEAKALALAVTIGDKNQFNSDFEDMVKAAGVSHVFVVSGMHLLILMGGITNLLGRLFYNKYFYALISFGGVLLLSVICGFTMSVIRAAVMYCLLAAAPLFGRENDPLNSLGATVCLVLIFSPYAIFSVAFQLSAASTLGILLFTKFITEKVCFAFKIVKGFVRKIIEIACVTVAATVMTAPICVYHFGYLSTVAIITNLFITHAVTYALLLNAIGIIIGLAFGMGAVSSAFLYLAGVLSEYSIKVINYFGNLKFSTISTPDCTVILFTAVAVLLVALYLIDKKHKYILSRRI